MLVAPQRFPDPDAEALASGATAVLAAARVVATLDEALAGAALAIGFSARPREFAGRVLPVRAAAHEALRMRAGAATSRWSSAARCRGCPTPSSRAASIVATIPADPGFASLNLAAAVQVAAYELRVAAHGGEVWRAPAFEPATQDEIERLFAHGEQVLIAMDFLDPAHPKRLLPRLRRLFARARLEKEEVNILRGILARIEERLSGRRDPGNT